MKRFALAAVAAIALLGLAGCDVFGSTEKKTTTTAEYTFPSGTGTGGTTSTTWWIKGSFDGWKGGDDFAAAPVSTDSTYPRHYLESDALNPNLLALPASVVSGLTQKPYEFVLINAVTKVKYDFVYSGSTIVLADNTAYSLVDNAAKLGSYNPAFVPTATTYTVLVDVAKATAPVIKLAPGATAVTPVAAPLLADLAAALKIKGDLWSIGWTDTAGTLSGNTVTFTGLKAVKKTGKFGFASADDFLKTDAVLTSTTTVNSPMPAVNISTRGSDIKFESVANRNDVYSIAVTIDPTKSVYAGRYSMVITPTTIGSGGWVYTPWTTVVLNGNWAGGDSNWVASQTMTNTAGVWTKDIVAGSTAVYFKPGKINWDDSTNEIVQGTGSLTLGGISADNLSFTAVSGNSYRVKVEFIGSYPTDGKPTVTVTDLGVVAP